LYFVTRKLSVSLCVSCRFIGVSLGTIAIGNKQFFIVYKGKDSLKETLYGP
jgi:hypothetical protein